MTTPPPEHRIPQAGTPQDGAPEHGTPQARTPQARTAQDRAPQARVPDGYDKHAFEPFAVTADLAVLTVRAGRLRVLLVERGEEPYAGRWALPGGFVRPHESAYAAARRELAEETGLPPSAVARLHLEQLHTYSDPARDPRMRVVSVAYTALVPDDLPEPRGGGDAARAAWQPCGSTGPGLAFDHAAILADARAHVGARLEHSALATALCPPEFTLGELRRVYEAVWGTALDPANFRRRILAADGFVERVPDARRLTAGRGKPAAVYRAGPARALRPPFPRPEGPPRDDH